MKRMPNSVYIICCAIAIALACNLKKTESKNDNPSNTDNKLKEDNITYTGDGATMNGYVVYQEGSDQKKRPAILVVHEWWGMGDYVKMRARELAKLGYIAMAVDVYGNGKQADNPDSAGKCAMPFYTNPQKAKTRLEAAMAKLRTYTQCDSANMAAIGYCFGGGILLNTVRMGSNLKGIVSFHGSLVGTPADKKLLKSKMLVCHGGADSFVPQKELDQFKKQIDSIGATSLLTVVVYDSATHAFTNPGATAMGEKFKMPIRYNEKADAASWNDMKNFFNTLFK
jgi:dienelactone hydrolase